MNSIFRLVKITNVLGVHKDGVKNVKNGVKDVKRGNSRHDQKRDNDNKDTPYGLGLNIYQLRKNKKMPNRLQWKN